jgi:hypothetical protein
VKLLAKSGEHFFRSCGQVMSMIDKKACAGFSAKNLGKSLYFAALPGRLPTVKIIRQLFLIASFFSGLIFSAHATFSSIYILGISRNLVATSGETIS